VHLEVEVHADGPNATALEQPHAVLVGDGEDLVAGLREGVRERRVRLDVAASAKGKHEHALLSV